MYVAVDQRAELLINGKPFLMVSNCDVLGTVKLSLKYGDVIAVIATNNNMGANLRVAFVSDGKQLIRTGDAGWNARNDFSPSGGRNKWMLPEYVDDNWPDAKTVQYGCTAKNFPRCKTNMD